MREVVTETTLAQLSTPTSWQLRVAPVRETPALTINIDRFRFRVGRRPTSDLILSSGQISGFHAEFVVVGIRLFVRDLNSTNGTYVNGKRIGHHDVALRHGDRVRMADVEFTVVRRRTAEPTEDTTVLPQESVDRLMEEPATVDPASVLDGS